MKSFRCGVVAAELWSTLSAETPLSDTSRRGEEPRGQGRGGTHSPVAGSTFFPSSCWIVPPIAVVAAACTRPEQTIERQVLSRGLLAG